MKKKSIYVKPYIKTFHVEASSMLASSGGITGNIPDIPWENESSGISADIDPIPFSGKRLLDDTLDDQQTINK